MTLRTYSYMNRRSEKVKAGEASFRTVYRAVDKRSDGICEFSLLPDYGDAIRCKRRATDHHHLYKPRRSHHEKDLVVALCRVHHERCEYPYKRGRLVILLVNGRHHFALRFASDKFAARNIG